MGNGESKPCSTCDNEITKKMKSGSLCKKCAKIVCEDCSIRDAHKLLDDGKKSIRICLVCKLSLDRQQQHNMTMGEGANIEENSAIVDAASKIGKPLDH